MKIGKIIYGGVGAVLAAAVALTGDYGLSGANLEIYRTAMSLQEDMDALGFSDFCLEDYKVRFFDGDADFVMRGEEIRRESPVFNTFVGTTCEVDGEYQVVLPVLENFSELFDLLGTAEALSEGSMSFDQESYGADEHTATLWHETFHAYQMTHFYDNCIGLLDGKEIADDMKNLIAEDVDSKEAVVKYFEREAELLRQAYFTGSREDMLSLIREYLKLEGERRELLAGDTLLAEDYLETMEGSARYVESRVIASLQGREPAEQQYMGSFTYENGSGKYYYTGMMKCYLLARLDPDWSADYTFDRSLNRLLEEASR